MDYRKAYDQALVNNFDETTRWTAYKNDHIKLKENLEVFPKSLEIDIMIPIVGTKALIPGKLYHTNEVLISHYSDLFSKVSAFKAKEVCEFRLNKANIRLQELETERDLFEQKLQLPNLMNAFANNQKQEIIEPYDEDTEKKWREEHKIKVREYKEKEAEERKSNLANEEDNKIMDLLDELEMMEELEDLENIKDNYGFDETNSVGDVIENLTLKDSCYKKEDIIIDNVKKEINKNSVESNDIIMDVKENIFIENVKNELNENKNFINCESKDNNLLENRISTISCGTTENDVKIDIEKQNIVDKKLLETKITNYLISVDHLSKIHKYKCYKIKLLEVQDYLDKNPLQENNRLEHQTYTKLKNYLQSHTKNFDMDETSKYSRISFSDQDEINWHKTEQQRAMEFFFDEKFDSESIKPEISYPEITLHIKFNHSTIIPSALPNKITPNENNEIIGSPSDIYVKFAHCFESSITEENIIETDDLKPSHKSTESVKNFKTILKNKEAVDSEEHYIKILENGEIQHNNDLPLTSTNTFRARTKISKFKMARLNKQ